MLAFQGSAPDELHKNFGANGKGPNWWDFPYDVHVDGNRVHSFYLDMWNGMKNNVFSAVDNAVGAMRVQNETPKKFIIAGFSMGGGVST